MKGVALCSVVCCLAFHLHLAVHGQEVEMCSDPIINYTPVVFVFSPTIVTHLSCSISNPSWWVSADPCGPFVRSELCPSDSNVCQFNVTSISNHFYHCCTSGGQVQDSAAEVSNPENCARIKICPTIDRGAQYAPPVGFFGETLRMYIQVFAHPPPSQTSRLFLGSDLLQNVTSVSVFQPSLTIPQFSYEYTVSLPSPQDTDSAGSLLFIADFDGAFCSEFSSVNFRVTLISRGAVDNTTPLPSTTTTTGMVVLRNIECAVNTGLLAGLVFLIMLFVATVVFLVLVIACLVHSLRRHKADLALSSRNPGRPSSLTMNASQAQYLRLQSQDQTPSPAVQYVNTPIGRPPSASQLNGAHPPPSISTPLPPSSLALGYTAQFSHTGQTPLIALTPADPNQPFPSSANVAPSILYEGLVTGAGAEQGSSGEYATVGGGSTAGGQGASPSEAGGASETIYSKETITKLASNVVLPDAADRKSVV